MFCLFQGALVMGMTDPLMTYIERQPLPPGFLAWLREVRKPSNFDEAVPDSLLNFDEVLILSTKWGQSDFTERVLKNAAVDVTAKLAGTGWTALHFAALFDRVATAEVLLKSGADVSANSDYGITPLHVATMAERMNMVEWLANNGADGNAIALNVPTPMAIALGNDRMDMVKAMWNSAYSKLEDLEKDTNSPVLSTLKEVFAGQELRLADFVFEYLRPVNFGDLKLATKHRDFETSRASSCSTTCTRTSRCSEKQRNNNFKLVFNATPCNPCSPPGLQLHSSEKPERRYPKKLVNCSFPKLP